MRTLFGVLVIEQNHTVVVNDVNEVNLPLSWTDNMVGVIPVFDNVKSAERYAEDKYNIIEIDAEEEDEGGEDNEIDYTQSD